MTVDKPRSKKTKEVTYANGKELLVAIINGEVPSDKMQEHMDSLEYRDYMAVNFSLLLLGYVAKKITKDLKEAK
jgi:hypothetical protein